MDVGFSCRARFSQRRPHRSAPSRVNDSAGNQPSEPSKYKYTSFVGFLGTRGVNPAHSLWKILIRAGDIEQNPGPVISCYKCQKTFREGQNNLQCQCGRFSHKQEKCSEVPRWKLNQIWSCSTCQPRQASGRTIAGRPVHDMVATVKPLSDLSICALCKKKNVRVEKPLVCSVCNAQIHKKCSKMDRKEMENIIAANAWRCTKCSPNVITRPAHQATQPTKVSEPPSEFDRRGSIKIIQWNADSILTKITELSECLKVHRVDICCIQETKLRPKHRTPTIDGYSTIRKDRCEGLGGGLIMFVKEDIPYREIHINCRPDSTLEIQRIEINTKTDGKLTFCNVYCPPHRGTTDDPFDMADIPTSDKTFVLGDLNGHDALWEEHQPSDPRGAIITDWLLTNNFQVCNDGSATRVNRGTGGISSPDITLASSRWAAKCEWITTECLGSDHLPILLLIDCRMKTSKIHPEEGLRWKTKDVDYSEFTRATEELFMHWEPTVGESLDMENKRFSNIMLEVAREKIGKIKVRNTGRDWMNSELRTEIKKRNTLRRTVANNREEWVNQCKKVQQMVAATKEEKWVSFIEDMDWSGDTTIAWRTIRALGSVQKTSTRNEVLIHKNKEFEFDRKKAEVFMKHYASVSKINLSKEDQKINRECKAAIKRSGVEPEEAKEFSMYELDRAIDQMRHKSAAGPDDISPMMIKSLGPLGKKILLQIMNKSWLNSLCPQDWRKAAIIPLLKAGKAASNVESFRPVSLTSCLAKTLERMIVHRLSFMTEENGWLSDDQSGFRKLRSTEDQVMRISQDISDGYQDPKPKRTVLALLDFSKAFDTVWRWRLIGILLETGVPLRFVKWVASFLKNRIGKVLLNGSLSSSHQIMHGVPQGAVISPLLFLFYINPVRQVIPRYISCSMYADDIAIWAQDRSKEQATIQTERGVQAIAKWSSEFRLSLNAGKCEVCLFTSDTNEAKWEPAVKIGNTTLAVNKNPVFLGVTLDRGLSFNAHLDKVIQRANNKCRILAAVANRKWGWKISNLRTIYLACIRSGLDYCGPAWQPFLSESNRDRLEVTQNKALRLITGQLKTTPVEAIRLEAGVTSYQTTIKRKCAIAYEKSLRLPPNNPRRSIAEKEVKHRLSSRSSWRREGQRLTQGIGLNRGTRQRLPATKHPPWKNMVTTNWKAVPDLLGKSDKKSEAAILKEDAINSIRRWSTSGFTIYTDRSAKEGTREGGSGVVITRGDPEAPTRIAHLSHRGRSLTSSYETEISAMCMALKWISDSRIEGDVVICTDSKAMLMALNGNGSADSADLQTLRQQLNDLWNVNITIQWVPGHCGLPGNEWVDEVAKQARDLDTPADPIISFSSAKAHIKAQLTDPPLSHNRLKLVYSQKPKEDSNTPCREAVLLAQLRSGHCPFLAAYQSIVKGSDPSCPHCSMANEDAIHWLLECETPARSVLAASLPWPSWSRTRWRCWRTAGIVRSCDATPQQQQQIDNIPVTEIQMSHRDKQ